MTITMFRHPRQINEAHCNFIRSLSCLICKDNTATECAHVRMAKPALGKRQTGKGERPDDKWTVPLCSSCHLDQHDIGEKQFWDDQMVDPIIIALALWASTGDHETGEQIVSAA